MRRTLSNFLLFLMLLAVPGLYAHAYVASSSNYRISRDSINTGGELSTSTNYTLEDTAGEVATGLGTSTSYSVKAGYQQNDTVTLSISSPADVVLSPSINGLLGGTASGTAIWLVTTTNSSGYTLSVKASASPALADGANNFADYTPAGAVPDYAWSIAASGSEFGFTPEGTDITSTYKDDGVNCNTGALDTARACWQALSTSDAIIASSASANAPSGTNTTLRVQAEAGTSAGQAVGNYQAIITATALAL